MKKQRFESVWDAIEDTAEEAENMKLRSQVMIVISKRIATQKLTQAAAAKLFGVTQPRISDLLRGKISVFSLDGLVNMAVRAGISMDLHIGPSGASKERKTAKKRTATHDREVAEA